MAADEPAPDEQPGGKTAERSPADFAETVERLEILVQQLESGELSLEGSLAAFEQGVRLTREAQQKLDAAELRVRTLTEGENGGPVLAPFRQPEETQEPKEGDNGER